MPVRQGWEISPDRIKTYDKIMSSDPVGDPTITSKLDLDREHGLFIASDNGFAWRIKMGFSSSMMSAGKSKWVRWHDVNDITPKKPGQVLVHLLLRKNGSLVIDKNGTPKIKRWKLTIQKHKGEPGEVFNQRKDTFIQILSEIWNNNRPSETPPQSDSRM